MIWDEETETWFSADEIIRKTYLLEMARDEYWVRDLSAYQGWDDAEEMWSQTYDGFEHMYTGEATIVCEHTGRQFDVNHHETHGVYEVSCVTGDFRFCFIFKQTHVPEHEYPYFEHSFNVYRFDGDLQALKRYWVQLKLARPPEYL